MPMPIDDPMPALFHAGPALPPVFHVPLPPLEPPCWEGGCPPQPAPMPTLLVWALLREPGPVRGRRCMNPKLSSPELISSLCFSW